MINKKILLALSAFLLLASSAIAQTITVRGTVKDAQNGDSIPFAALQVKGTSTGVSADIDGMFTISVSKNATIIFSSVGYIEKAVEVGEKTTIDVFLEPDSESLEATVVVGYGSAKKLGNLVSTIATVKSDIVKNAPSSSALDQLQGQVAGLSVMTTGGVAGDDNVGMTLHGRGSLGSGRTPLYIIDGVPSTSRSIMTMNPNDILTISVFKDASATSIYGSRAANGVVYVTTKSGSYDSKATVTVRSQYGISTLANTTLYENMMSGDELKAFWIKTGMYLPQQIENNYTKQGYTANTEWYKVMQRLSTPQTQNDVTFEGGGQKVAYMISASQFHQEGTTVGNYYDRYTVRTNVQGHPKDWLKVGINMNISLDENQSNPNWGSAGYTAAITAGGMSYMINPLYPAYDENGEMISPKFANGLSNPYVYMETYPSVTNNYSLNAGAYVELEPIKNLKFRSQLGTDSRFAFSNSKSLPSSPIRSGTGSRSRSAGITSNNTITNTIEYSTSFHNAHDFSILLGQEGISNYYDSFSASSSGQTEDRLLTLNNGTSDTRGVSESRSESKFLSFFGHTSYAYQGKYNLDFTLRNDASSRFGRNYRHAMFWSAGAKWNASKEDFMKGISWIDNLSFKLSYGTQGNANIGNYNHLALIGTTTKYADGTSWIVSQPSNPDLTWEKQSLLSVGTSARLFKKLDLEIEYYNRRTSDMLMGVPYPYTSGFSQLTANVGGLSNSGFDLTIGIDAFRTKDAYLRINNTFNYNYEKITELFDAAWDENLQRHRWILSDMCLAYVEGLPVMFYGPIYAGVDPADGAPMWYVPGPDPDVTTMEETTKVFDEAALTQNTGLTYNTPFTGGFSIEGGWRILSFRADFSYVLGKTLVNNDALYYANPNENPSKNTHKSVNDYWTPSNTDAQYPDWTKGYTMKFDTHLYENADFLRLKSLQAGVALPKKWVDAQNIISNARLTFTGRNLLTFTKYTGVDPEVGSNLSYGRPGNTKQYLFGLEITF